MRKIISKYINIISICLLTIVFAVSGVNSYNKHEKAQSEFMRSSLGFLLSEKKDENFTDTLDYFKNAYDEFDILYKNKNKIIYSTENFNLDEYKKLKKENLKESKNPFGEKIYIDELENNGNTLVLMERDSVIEKLSYFDFKLYFFLMMIMFFLNFTISNRIFHVIMKPIKKYKKKENALYTSDEYILRDLESFYSSVEDKDNNLEEENEILKSKIFNIKDMTDNLEEGVIFFNKSGNIEIINEAARIFLSADRNSSLNTLIDADEYKIALRETKLLSISKSLDIKIGKRDIKLFIDPLLDGSYLILAIDYSESKKAEILRKEFTANVTHELKSPLTSINGYAELISEGIAKGDDIQKFAQIICTEGNRLLNIIDDILKLSKLEGNSKDNKKVYLDVKAVFDSCILKFKNMTDERDIEVTNKIKSFELKTDDSLFQDLLSNIYENAIKYNRNGGKIILSDKLEDDFYYIYIEDTGLGIKEEDVARIFERFYVVDKARSRNMKSTGLGLSIVKHICDYLNYGIEVESEYGKGSKFIIKIKL